MATHSRRPPERLGWLTPTDPKLPRAALWEQYQAQGYLWLKGLLDRAEILAFRRRYFEAFRETNLLAPGTDPQDGIYSGEPVENFNKLLVEIVRWAAYESFCLAQPIWQFYEMFLEGAPYLHKRKLIRHTRPGDSKATGAHYGPDLSAWRHKSYLYKLDSDWRYSGGDGRAVLFGRLRRLGTA